MASPRLFHQEKPMKETLLITLGEALAEIPLQPLPKGQGYFAYFKLNDIPEFVEEGARLVANHIRKMNLNNAYFVTPEASTLALAHVLRTKYGVKGCTVYKNKQINDVDPISIQYDTVTAIDQKTLYLGKNRIEEMKGKDIIILDSICTTGGTLKGTYNLLVKAGIAEKNIIDATVLFTEGERRENLEVSPGKLLKLTSFAMLPIVKAEYESKVALS